MGAGGAVIVRAMVAGEMRGEHRSPTNPGFVCLERHQRQPPDSSEIQLQDIAVLED
jgi:hypothetical protein